MLWFAIISCLVGDTVRSSRLCLRILVAGPWFPVPYPKSTVDWMASIGYMNPFHLIDDSQFPLHNNAAESDIREQVIRRHISGSTHSDAGRRARDALTGAKKTCRKLGISFWDFLLSRFRGDGTIPPLPDIIRAMSIGLRQVTVPI